jgi:hypothetical protein
MSKYSFPDLYYQIKKFVSSEHSQSDNSVVNLIKEDQTRHDILKKLDHGSVDKFIRIISPQYRHAHGEVIKNDKAFISECVNKLCENVDLVIKDDRKKVADVLRNDEALLSEFVSINEKILLFLDEQIDQNVLFKLIQDKPQLIKSLSLSQKTDDTFIQKLCVSKSKTEKTWCHYYCEEDKDIKIDKFPQQKYTYSKGARFPIREDSQSVYNFILFSV